jgi:hypothetical protein
LSAFSSFIVDRKSSFIPEWLTVKVRTRRNARSVKQARVRVETYLLPMFRGTVLTSISLGTWVLGGFPSRGTFL